MEIENAQPLGPIAAKIEEIFLKNQNETNDKKITALAEEIWRTVKLVGQLISEKEEKDFEKNKNFIFPNIKKFIAKILQNENAKMTVYFDFRLILQFQQKIIRVIIPSANLFSEERENLLQMNNLPLDTKFFQLVFEKKIEK